MYHIVLLMMVYKYKLSLKLYWRRFVNRKDWEPTSSSYICIKHFEEKYYKKGKNSTHYRLAINMKLVATVIDPKKVIRNKQCYFDNLYSSEDSKETFISRRSTIWIIYLSKDSVKDFTCLNNTFPSVSILLERMITMSYFTS